MREANIIIFEDHPGYIEGIQSNFHSRNHSSEYSFDILGVASTMSEARDLIDRLEDGEVDFAIVDGNLTPGETDSHEGGEIVELLNQNFSEIVTIGFSASTKDFGTTTSISKSDLFKPLVDYVKDYEKPTV